MSEENFAQEYMETIVSDDLFQCEAHRQRLLDILSCFAGEMIKDGMSHDLDEFSVIADLYKELRSRVVNMTITTNGGNI